MSLVRKRIVLPLIPTDIFQVIRPTQNKDAVLDLTYQQLLTALSEVFSGGGSLILLQTNGVDNGDQNLLNLVAGSGITLSDDGLGAVTITSSGGSSFITSVADTASIDLTVTSGILTGNLVDIVAAGTFGSGTQVPQITIDTKGRVTSVSLVNITAGSGTVTGVTATSPITSSGGTAPVISTSMATNKLIGRGTAGTGVMEEITLGTNLSLSGSTLNASGGSGTVASVSASVPSPTTPALSVLVTNPTTTPAIAITANGTTSQYVRGDGSLETTVTKTSELYNDGDNGTSHFISLEDLPSNLTLYATNVASGISTYTKAVSSLTDPSYNSVAVDIPIGPLTSTSVATYCGGVISSANIIVGNPGIFTMSTIGNIRRTGGTAQGVFYYEIYKRDSGGTETLIVASSNTIPVSASAYTEFNAAALFNNGVFTATDRVVIKFYGFRLSGGSDPSFDFQFGGIAPVRTTLPIPLVVTPANGVTSVGTGTGLTGGTITNTGTISLNTKLAPADTLTGKSLQYLRVNLLETAVEYATVTSGGDSIQALAGSSTDVTASASLPSQSVAATLAASYKKGSVGVVFDGADGVITANTVAYAQVPYNGTITAWTIVSKPTAVGTCTVTAFKSSSYPPIVSTNNIFNTQPALTGTAINSSTSPSFVSGQDVVTAGDWIGFRITLPVTVTWVSLTLSITKTV